MATGWCLLESQSQLGAAQPLQNSAEAKAILVSGLKEATVAILFNPGSKLEWTELSYAASTTSVVKPAYANRTGEGLLDYYNSATWQAGWQVNCSGGTSNVQSSCSLHASVFHPDSCTQVQPSCRRLAFTKHYMALPIALKRADR